MLFSKKSAICEKVSLKSPIFEVAKVIKSQLSFLIKEIIYSFYFLMIEVVNMLKTFFSFKKSNNIKKCRMSYLFIGNRQMN